MYIQTTSSKIPLQYKLSLNWRDENSLITMINCKNTYFRISLHLYQSPISFTTMIPSIILWNCITATSRRIVEQNLNLPPVSVADRNLDETSSHCYHACLNLGHIQIISMILEMLRFVFLKYASSATAFKKIQTFALGLERFKSLSAAFEARSTMDKNLPLFDVLLISIGRYYWKSWIFAIKFYLKNNELFVNGSRTITTSHYSNK